MCKNKINQIKKIILLYGLTVLFSYGLFSCSEEPVGQTPTDSTAPGKIINPTVENLPGGAKISYTLPGDKDLLYVEVVYTINGVEKTDAASLYANSVEVMGYGSTDEQTVSLYCIDRSGNRSEPVEVKIHPTTPPVLLIENSMQMFDDWGGVKITWENVNKAPVAIYIMAADSTGELYVADVTYTSLAKGSFNVRGFDSTERLFGAFVRDRYDNYSDTLKSMHTPMFEQLLDKSLFRPFVLYGDNTTYLAAGYEFWRMYNDDYNDFYHQAGQDPDLPDYITIDLGVSAQLNRYTLWERPGFYYDHFNLKQWRVWGTNNLKLTSDPDYWLEGFKDDWFLLADCVAFQPSGGPTVTQEDRDFAAQGYQFTFPDDAPPVRYIRIEKISTFTGNPYFEITEVTFWGKILEVYPIN